MTHRLSLRNAPKAAAAAASIPRQDGGGAKKRRLRNRRRAAISTLVPAEIHGGGGGGGGAAAAGWTVTPTNSGGGGGGGGGAASAEASGGNNGADDSDEGDFECGCCYGSDKFENMVQVSAFIIKEHAFSSYAEVVGTPFAPFDALLFSCSIAMHCDGRPSRCLLGLRLQALRSSFFSTMTS